jgi:ribosomal protein S27AE
MTMHWKCPKCGSTRLAVEVKVWCDLTQSEENFETEIQGQDHEWDVESQMICGECSYQDIAAAFFEEN